MEAFNSFMLLHAFAINTIPQPPPLSQIEIEAKLHCVQAQNKLKNQNARFELFKISKLMQRIFLRSCVRQYATCE